ncbi:MAG: GDSL-type esterase/lipase family protein [Planctomycetota bacterium]
MRQRSDTPNDETSSSEPEGEAPSQGFKRPSGLLRSFARTSAVALSLLSFPSIMPWMVAFWIACHTAYAKWNRPAWVPLVICLGVMIAKLVPRTPAVIAIGLLFAFVAVIRFKRRHEPNRQPRWWTSAIVLWGAWVFVFLEWQAIETCNRPLTLDAERPIVCLGDSLTDGMFPDHGYPDQLKTMVSVPVINLGFSGISTSQGLGQMQRVLDHDPQVVVIELGGHDFLKGRGRTSTKQNLLAMIEQCRANDAEVVLMEIPRGFIFDPYASLEREIAYEQDVQPVADTWLRQIVLLGPAAPPGIWLPDVRLSDDGIHSNTRGSHAIAKRVAKALGSMYGDQVFAER